VPSGLGTTSRASSTRPEPASTGSPRGTASTAARWRGPPPTSL
jgi:hypothetical protein